MDSEFLQNRACLHDLYTEKIVLNVKMYDHYPEAVVISKNGLITYINEAGLSLAHVQNAENVVGANIVQFIHPSQQPDIVKRINNVFDNNEPLLFSDLILIIGNQKQIIVEAISIPIYDCNGNRVLFSIVRDVTERKRSEEMLLQSEKLSVIGQLAAGVAHEIRNPLTALKGFTQLLKSKLPDQANYLNIMITEIDRINLIVNEFMSLAKPHYSELTAGRLEPIIQSVISILETQAIMFNVEIRTEIEGQLPIVLCNENQLKQVFLNVIKNGIEAMPEGGELLIKCELNSNNKVIITFTDTGEGIPEELLPKLGEPFVTTKEKGTGLGLMISSRIIEEHNGKLSISSRHHVGTTVMITLPAHMQDLH